MIGSANVRKLKERDEILKGLLKVASLRLSGLSTSDPAGYAGLLKKLIVQGLVKLNESSVSVRCREVDLDVVKGVVGDALNEVLF